MLTTIPTANRVTDLPFWVQAFYPEASFGGNTRQAVTVDYVLKTTGENPFDQAYRPLTQGEIDNIETSLERVGANSGLSFREVANEADADMVIGASSDTDETAYGRTWQFTSASMRPVEVVAYDHPYSDAGGLARNSYIYIHEIMHGVGLDHSTRAFGSRNEVVIPDDQDNGTTLFGSWSSAWTSSIQLFDLAVLQYLYGPDTSARAGNDTYTPILDAYAPATDANANVPLLWDGAGIDTIDLSSAGGGATAGLAPGLIYQVNTTNTGILEAGTYSINYGSWFERLIGTDHDDTLSGYSADETIQGGAGSDIITPGAGSDSVDGGAGSDMVSFVDYAQGVSANLETGQARSGSDTDTLTDVENLTGSIFGDFLQGNEADNRIRGLGDFDWMVGSEGADYYDGGNGRDMISYVYADAGVTVDLGAGRGRAGQAEGDRYDSVERATGSIHSDLFFGGDGEEDFRGLGGYDWFVGSAGGKDRYDGGTGLDTVAYSASNAGVVASLLLGRGTAGDAARDLYTSIERLTGSSFDDLLTGDNGRNVLRGLYGEDTLLGNGGVDYLTGGGSDDYLDGGAGWDVAVFDGNRADYTITTGTSGVIVTANTGGDGRDTLFNMEALQFADDMVFL